MQAMAYREQLGWNRHTGPASARMTFDKVAWYRRIRVMRRLPSMTDEGAVATPVEEPSTASGAPGRERLRHLLQPAPVADAVDLLGPQPERRQRREDPGGDQIPEFGP